MLNYWINLFTHRLIKNTALKIAQFTLIIDLRTITIKYLGIDKIKPFGKQLDNNIIN